MPHDHEEASSPAPAADPIAAFRGKKFDLTDFERRATRDQLARVTEAQNRILSEATTQVLLRNGMPEDLVRKGVPCRFLLKGGALTTIEVLGEEDAASLSPPAPPAKKPKAKARGKRS